MISFNNYLKNIHSNCQVIIKGKKRKNNKTTLSGKCIKILYFLNLFVFRYEKKTITI